MGIERKCLVKQIPEDYESFPCHAIEQVYLCTGLVVHVRREDDSYHLTYKGEGFLSRGEYSLSLNEQAYHHLLTKADDIIFTKKRCLIPVEGASHLTIETDVLEGPYQGLVLVEAKFPTKKEVATFRVPEWFGRDVTFPDEFQNSCLACGGTNILCKRV